MVVPTVVVSDLGAILDSSKTKVAGSCGAIHRDRHTVRFN